MVLFTLVKREPELSKDTGWSEEEKLPVFVTLWLMTGTVSY